MIQRQLSLHLLQALVLFPQVPQPPQIGGLETSVVRVPPIKHGAADIELTADVLHWNTGLRALQSTDNLVLTELTLAQDGLLVGTVIMAEFLLSCGTNLGKLDRTMRC